MGGSRKRRQTKKTSKTSQKGGGYWFISNDLTPDITDADSLRENMDVYFISAHGESQVGSYFCVPPNTFLLFNANAGDFGYMRASDRSWIDNQDTYFDILFRILYGRESTNTVKYREANYRLLSTQIYFPGDLLPNNRVMFANTPESFRPMGIFTLPLNSDHPLLRGESIWPLTDREYADPSLMYNRIKATLNTSKLPNLTEHNEIPRAEVDKILAPYTDFPNIVGKTMLLSDVLKRVETEKKYRFFFLPICRGAPLQYDPKRMYQPSTNTPAYKLLRRMSFHARRKDSCPTVGATLSLLPVLNFTNAEMDEMQDIAYKYYKATGTERYIDYTDGLVTLKNGSPISLTYFSFYVAMAGHPIPSEFKGTPLETSLKNLTKVLKPISKNILERFPAKNNTRRQPQQVLTNTFGHNETGYSFFHNAPPRINEYGEELGEVFSNAKNAPEHVKIARGNTI